MILHRLIHQTLLIFVEDHSHSWAQLEDLSCLGLCSTIWDCCICSFLLEVADSPFSYTWRRLTHIIWDKLLIQFSLDTHMVLKWFWFLSLSQRVCWKSSLEESLWILCFQGVCWMSSMENRLTLCSDWLLLIADCYCWLLHIFPVAFTFRMLMRSPLLVLCEFGHMVEFLLCAHVAGGCCC